MKIEIIMLFGVIYASMAQELNNTTTAIPVSKPSRPKFHTIYYNATESQPECSLTVLKFPGTYLRGVTIPNMITYNNVSNFKSCQKKCCYEKSFHCKSLSYFRTLRQCFVMNLTRHDDGAQLIPFKDIVHVQTLTEYDFMTTESPEEETTEISITTEATTVGGKDTTTVSQDKATTESADATTDGEVAEEYTTDPTESTSTSGRSGSEDGRVTTPSTSVDSVNLSTEQTTAKSVKDGSKSIGSGNENPTGVLNEPPSAAKLIARDCSVNCSGNGRCLQKKVDDSVTNEYYCECNKGFDGTYCETKVTEEGGLAVWIIVVIVIAILILILIIVACVLLKLYKKKGEYRVVDYFRRWTRRQKKPKKPDNPNEIAHNEYSNEPFPPNATSRGLHEDSTRTAV